MKRISGTRLNPLRRIEIIAPVATARIAPMYHFATKKDRANPKKKTARRPAVSGKVLASSTSPPVVCHNPISALKRTASVAVASMKSINVRRLMASGVLRGIRKTAVIGKTIPRRKSSLLIVIEKSRTELKALQYKKRLQ